MAKSNQTDMRCVTVDTAHATTTSAAPSLLQTGYNIGYAMGATFRQAIRHLKRGNQRVRSQSKPTLETFRDDNETIMVTYNTGVDSNYVSEAERKKVVVPILRQSTKRVGIANGNTSSGKFITQLLFPQLPKQAVEADTFQEFSRY